MRTHCGLVFSVCLLSLASASRGEAANHYVDNAAAGANNGSSWADAWQSIGAIQWNTINPGDTIYLSGGASQKIYLEQMDVGASGAAGAEITITKGVDPGHDGKVIIDGGDGARQYCIYLRDQHHVVIRGLGLRGAGFADGSSDWGAGIMLHYTPEYITLDGLDITDIYGRGIFIVGNNSVADGAAANHLEIKNSRISTFDDINNQTDCIYAQHAADISLHHNFIQMKNTSLHNHHSNPLQAHQTRGWKIYNNVLRTERNGLGEAIILGAEDVAGDPVDAVVIYNNYIYQGGNWRDGYWEGGGTNDWQPGSPYADVLETRWYGFNQMPPTYIIHNTLVSDGPFVVGLNMEYGAEVRNNIIVQYGDGSNPGTYNWVDTMSAGPTIAVANITGNLMWRQWGPVAFWMTVSANGNEGQVTDWSGWVGTWGGDGINAEPLFRNPVGSLSAELQDTSPGVHAGQDLRTLVASFGLPWEDLYGNPRGATPTIGAYEDVPPVTNSDGGAGSDGGTAADGGTGTDGGADAGTGPGAASGGCGCHTTGSTAGAGLLGLVLLGAVAAGRPGRRRTRS